MRWKSLGWIALLLAIPAVPFLLLGDRLDRRVETLLAAPLSPAQAAGWVVLVLASDVLLPVPSSAVSTFAGARLGIAGGTLASWVGMTLGSSVAFALARWLGPRFTRPRVSTSDERGLSRLSQQWGPAALALLRPVPLLAEASVLLAGGAGLSWRAFVVPVWSSNLAIALVYAVAGKLAATSATLTWTLAGSIVAPLALTWLVRKKIAPPAETDDQQAANGAAPAAAAEAAGAEPANRTDSWR